MCFAYKNHRGYTHYYAVVQDVQRTGKSNRLYFLRYFDESVFEKY